MYLYIIYMHMCTYMYMYLYMYFSLGLVKYLWSEVIWHHSPGLPAWTWVCPEAVSRTCSVCCSGCEISWSWIKKLQPCTCICDWGMWNWNGTYATSVSGRTWTTSGSTAGRLPSNTLCVLWCVYTLVKASANLCTQHMHRAFMTVTDLDFVDMFDLAFCVGHQMGDGWEHLTELGLKGNIFFKFVVPRRT